MSNDKFKALSVRKSLILVALSAALLLSIGLPFFLRTNTNTFDKLVVPKIVQLKSDAKQGEHYLISNYPPKNHTPVYNVHTTASFAGKEGITADFTELSEIQSNPPAFTGNFINVKNQFNINEQYFVLVADRKTPVLPTGASPVAATFKKVIYYLHIKQHFKSHERTSNHYFCF